MSAEHVRYYKFENLVTRAIFRSLVDEPINGEEESLGAKALDRAWTFVNEVDSEEDGFDLLDSLATNIESALEYYLADIKVPAGWLIDAGMEQVDFKEVARAVLIHGDQWEPYLQDKEESEDKAFWEEEGFTSDDVKAYLEGDDAEEEEEEAEQSAT